MKLIVERIEDVKTLTEEKDGRKEYYIEGVYLQSDVKNRNNRVYPEAVMDKAVATFIKERIKENLAVGELNHPESPRINHERVTHKILSLTKEGKNYIGKAKILNTPLGNLVKGLLDDDVRIGVSSRGLGSVKEGRNGINEVQDDFWISTIDIVSDPSAPEAFVNGIMEGKEYIIENGIISERMMKRYQKRIEKAGKQRNQEYFRIFCEVITRKFNS